MKRLTSFFLAAVMLISILGSVNLTYAQEWIAGENVKVTVDSGVLTVSGSGEMTNYAKNNLPPWMQNNGEITKVVVEQGVTSIGDFAFSSMMNVTEADISDTVTYIGERAFSGCYLLSRIDIPASVDTIGNCAFSTSLSGMTNLAEITVDGNNKSFTVENGILYNNVKTIIYKIPPKANVEVLDVPSSVISIKSEAALTCTSIKEVNLPESVSFVGAKAFAECKNLTKVVVNNRDCELELGAVPDNAGLKLYGYSNSNVALYAQNNGYSNIEFVPFECEVHKWDDGVVTKAATCTATGVKTYTCTVCGATKTETIAKTAHTYKNYVTKATTSANGSIVNKCSVCGAVKSSTTIAYPKTITLSTTSYTYDGKSHTPAVTVKDSAGKTLVRNTDYVLKYASGRTNAGTYYVDVVFQGNYSGTKRLTFKINPISATKCTATLNTTATYYNGSVKTPTVTVKCGSTTLKKGTDYTVSYASGRKLVGRYAVKVTYKGNYSGTKTLYFNIIPRGTTVSKVTAKSKGFTVSWATQKTQTTGYQIQYSTSSNFANAKTITMPKSTYYAKSITGLTGNKKYYVRVRTYKVTKFGGKNYNIYSPWSAAKSVTTKR